MKSNQSDYQNCSYSNYHLSESPRFFSPPKSANLLFDDGDKVPSEQKFNEIVNCYLNNLSPKKRDKALINQNRYMQIQQVLNDPKNTTHSTAQFRFWVKKMFRFEAGSKNVVFHDKKPVATKDSIYTILVKAHREVHHGGRDKTSALVRKRYSWIPKELVAQFVRHCPFCITRRNSAPCPMVDKIVTPIRHAYSFDSGITNVDMPFNEDSDMSSATPTSVNGHEPVNYVSSPPSLKRNYSQESRELFDYRGSFHSYDNLYSTPTHPLVHPSDDVLFYAHNDQNVFSNDPLYGYYANQKHPLNAPSLFMRSHDTSSIELLSHHGL